MSQRAEFEKRIQELEAVIAKAATEVKHGVYCIPKYNLCSCSAEKVLATLNSAPGEALTEDRAKVWDEAIQFFEDNIYGEPTSARKHNPYREESDG